MNRRLIELKDLMESQERKGAVRRRKSAMVTASVTGMLASIVLTGCTPSGNVVDADYAKVCQDRTTKQRVEDSKCSEDGRHSAGMGWYFLPMHAPSGGSSGGAIAATSVPAVGQTLVGGKTSIPSTSTSKSGVSTKGGAITRGGFGSSAKGGSSGG